MIAGICQRLALRLAIIAALAIPSVVSAHPVPRRAHDRTVEVRLEPKRLVVSYRLEVDPFTVVFDDIPAVDDQVDTSKLKKPDDFYEAFTRCYAPILAGNLTASLDGKPLVFRCTRREYRLRDKDDKPLDHLRCDFDFEAGWEPAADTKHTFRFHEGNYERSEEHT